MAPGTIDYYFGPQSPWAYLGHERLFALVRKSGAAVRVKPCDLPYIFSKSGGLPLAQRAPQRQSYRLLELRRYSTLLGVPLNLAPRHFPVSGDAAARLILTTEAEHGAIRALEMAGAIGRALWVEERDIALPATLEAIALGLGLDGARLLVASQGEDALQRYRQTTEEALAAEVFGAPTYVFRGERYWGQDRLDLLERAVLGQAV